MKSISLKTAAIFWQEIVFIIPLGVLLIEMSTKYAVVFAQTFDMICFFFFLVLFICLIGQFSWKRKTLAIFLSWILGLCSAFLIFAALYAIAKSPQLITSVAMLIFGFFLMIAAVTMPDKFASN